MYFNSNKPWILYLEIEVLILDFLLGYDQKEKKKVLNEKQKYRDISWGHKKFNVLSTNKIKKLKTSIPSNKI